MSSRFTLFSDPVHGFISVPRGDLFDLIQTPEVQRLRRIRQLGVGHLVFSGAEHSRFGHALGAMALMREGLRTLSDKGADISPEEAFATTAAALLHDVGHGPFSHTLEDALIEGFEHEAMSRLLIVRLNERFGGRLGLALRIFDGEYHRPFLHQLVSSQLDMDRLDYLRRDSYYTGVVEGRVGIARILKTMRVTRDGALGIDAKGLYAVESFLFARRLMYWQVYLHKTVVAGDQVLRSALRRARDLVQRGDTQPLDQAAPALRVFLENRVVAEDLSNSEVRDSYASLDDSDILFSLKQWRVASDPILRDLAIRFLDRRFFRTRFLRSQPSKAARNEWRSAVRDWMVGEGLSDGDEGDASYYCGSAEVRHRAYDREQNPIVVRLPDGSVTELTQAADSQAIASLARLETKPFVCGPKEVAFPSD